MRRKIISPDVILIKWKSLYAYTTWQHFIHGAYQKFVECLRHDEIDKIIINFAFSFSGKRVKEKMRISFTRWKLFLQLNATWWRSGGLKWTLLSLLKPDKNNPKTVPRTLFVSAAEWTRVLMLNSNEREKKIERKSHLISCHSTSVNKKDARLTEQRQKSWLMVSRFDGRKMNFQKFNESNLLFLCNPNDETRFLRNCNCIFTKVAIFHSCAVAGTTVVQLFTPWKDPKRKSSSIMQIS